MEPHNDYSHNQYLHISNYATIMNITKEQGIWVKRKH